MAQTQKLEHVLDLLLSENQDKAADVLHQIIVEKARTIYEGIVSEEERVVGAEDDTEDFTSEISDDTRDIDADEENDGEVDGDDDTESESDDVEDRVDDLEAQLAELRAEFNALMDEEMDEPNHADLADTIAAQADDDQDDADLSTEDPAELFGSADTPKLKTASQSKNEYNGQRVAEETQFLTKVADTGQRGTAKLVGTGNKSSLGSENNASPYAKSSGQKSYGGTPVKFSAGTGGEYGKYTAGKAKDETPTDNVGVEPKRVSDKYGKQASSDSGSKSPLSKKP